MDKDMLLQGLRESRKEKDALSVEEVLELNALYEKLREIDLEKVVAERVASRTPVEQLVEDLKANVPSKRTLKKVQAAARPHYHTKRAAKRKRHREFMREVYRPRRKAELASRLDTPEGWWEYINISWTKRSVKVELTFEEFKEHIYPVTAGKGLVFVVLRYDAKKPIALENVLVKDTKSRKVLFDGMEYKLRSLGCII